MNIAELKKLIEEAAKGSPKEEIVKAMQESRNRVIKQIFDSDLDTAEAMANNIGSLFLNVNVILAMKIYEKHVDCDDETCQWKQEGHYPKEILEDLLGRFQQGCLRALEVNCVANGVPFERKSSVNEKLVQELLKEIGEE